YIVGFLFPGSLYFLSKIFRNNITAFRNVRRLFILFIFGNGSRRRYFRIGHLFDRFTYNQLLSYRNLARTKPIPRFQFRNGNPVLFSYLTQRITFLYPIILINLSRNTLDGIFSYLGIL